MRLGPPPPVTDPALAAWLQSVYTAFARGLGFPHRFQIGDGTVSASPSPLPGVAFLTVLPGDPTTFTNDPAVDPDYAAISNDPIGSLFLRTDGGANTTLYVKEAALAAGWAPK